MAFFGIFGRNTAKSERVRVIDIEAYISEILPHAPSGEKDLEYDPLFMELEEKIKGVPEIRHDDKIVQKREEPKWTEIQGAALALLARSHDLRVAISLLRALTHTNGAPGVRDGLELLYGLIDRYWDTLYPQTDPDDDNDPTQRINILLNLCDRESMLQPLLNVPLCASRAMGKFSLRDIQVAIGKITVPEAEKKNAPDMTKIEAAFKDCDDKELAATGEAVAESLEIVDRLETLLAEKIGSEDAPQFTELHQVLKEMHTALIKEEPRRTPAIFAKPEKKIKSLPVNAPQTIKSTSYPSVKSMETIADRQDVISLLEKICDYYELNEPASPVPLLLKRAMQLVEKDFMAIIEELAPESIDRIKQICGVDKEKN